MITYIKSKSDKKSSWPECVKKMADWYVNNVESFFGDNENDLKVRNKKILKHARDTKFYYCDLIQKEVKDDCIGFVIACLQYYGIFTSINCDKTTFTTELLTRDIYKHGKLYKELVDNGAKILNYNKDKLEPFDIYIGNAFFKMLKSENNGNPYNKDNVMTNKFDPKDIKNNNKEENLKNHTHHCEIYAGDGKAYTWGKLHKKLPVDMYDRKYNYIIRII